MQRNDDEERTTLQQEDRIEKYEEKETDNSRRKEELHKSQLFWCVVRRAKKADENVSRPEDSIVTEMINAFLKKDLWNSSVSKLALWVRKKRRTLGDSKIAFLRKPDAEPKKGIRRYRAVALTSVMSRWDATCLKRNEPGDWQQRHVGGVEGIRCEHFQDHAATTETLELQERRQEEGRLARQRKHNYEKQYLNRTLTDGLQS